MSDSASKRRSNTVPRTDSRSRSSDKKGKLKGDATAEKGATQAAQCNGLFAEIAYPWTRTYNMEIMSFEYQQRSPFYFKGRHVTTGACSFLKVWREGERSYYDEILDEFRFMKQAQECGVSVAQLILDELNQVTVYDNQFYVLAIEFIHNGAYRIESEDICLFVRSLINETKTLHEKAAILHCDLKPDNVMWDSKAKSVRLIDFGHAQSEHNAKSYRSTKGYEAPEVLAGDVHSRSSDAYTVGWTILNVLESIESRGEEVGEMGVIRRLAQGLAEDNPVERWSLVLALEELPIVSQGVAPPAKESSSLTTSILKSSSSLVPATESPPKKVARVCASTVGEGE